MKSMAKSQLIANSPNSGASMKISPDITQKNPVKKVLIRCPGTRIRKKHSTPLTSCHAPKKITAYSPIIHGKAIEAIPKISSITALIITMVRVLYGR